MQRANVLRANLRKLKAKVIDVDAVVRQHEELVSRANAQEDELATLRLAKAEADERAHSSDATAATLHEQVSRTRAELTRCEESRGALETRVTDLQAAVKRGKAAVTSTDEYRAAEQKAAEWRRRAEGLEGELAAAKAELEAARLDLAGAVPAVSAVPIPASSALGSEHEPVIEPPEGGPEVASAAQEGGPVLASAAQEGEHAIALEQEIERLHHLGDLWMYLGSFTHVSRRFMDVSHA